MIVIIRTLIWALIWAVFQGARFRQTRQQTRQGSNKIYLHAWAFVFFNAIAAVALAMIATGHLVAIFVFAASVCLAYPWILAKTIFIPLGMWRTAFVFGWLARLAWPTDGSGAAAVAALALHRKRRPVSNTAIEFIERQIRRHGFSSAAVLASALIADLRQDQNTAIERFESIGQLDLGSHSRAHLIAGNWLIAEAARRGHWRQVEKITSNWLTLSSGGRFFAQVAARILDSNDSPSNTSLWLYWIFCGSPRLCYPLLKRALAANNDRSPIPFGTKDSQPISEQASEKVNDLDNPLSQALALHASLLGRRHIGQGIELTDIIEVGLAWDRATESLSNQAQARGAALQSRRIEAVTRDFLAAIDADLAHLIRESGQCVELLPARSPTLTRAASVIREQLLIALELGFDALADRTDAQHPLDSIDEWIEYQALRKQHRTLVRVGGFNARRVIFPKLHNATCNYAAWLWNKRSEYVLATAIFRWLLSEAIVVNDARAIKLQRSNLEITS